MFVRRTCLLFVNFKEFAHMFSSKDGLLPKRWAPEKSNLFQVPGGQPSVTIVKKNMRFLMEKLQVKSDANFSHYVEQREETMKIDLKKNRLQNTESCCLNLSSLQETLYLPIASNQSIRHRNMPDALCDLEEMSIYFLYGI